MEIGRHPEELGNLVFQTNGDPRLENSFNWKVGKNFPFPNPPGKDREKDPRATLLTTSLGTDCNRGIRYAQG